MSTEDNTRTACLDLAPARWIWLPSRRCLPNSFVLFRRELELQEAPERGTGWLTADSRYLLTVNGKRIQWGPAPSDPRHQEADPMDLGSALQVGPNVIGVEVLYYGSGDGTWPMGAPGFIFKLDITLADGTSEQVISDESWLCRLDRAHPPGMYKRWFLRALQEEFDARVHPFGWDRADYKPDASWRNAAPLNGDSRTPSLFAGGPEYILRPDVGGVPGQEEQCELRRRQIPLMDDSLIAASALRQQGRLNWHQDPLDWFEMGTPKAFDIAEEVVAEEIDDAWRIPANSGALDSLFLTFELDEQMVGWPRLVVDAPEGTVVELIFQEAHDPEHGPLWLDTQHFHWARLICREGVNEFETFDFESLRWIQLNIREARRPVTVRWVGVRRRIYPWPHAPRIACGDPRIQHVLEAAINTLCNCAQETCVDGMGRERQQYSGDVAHQLQAIRYVFGEQRQPRRFLRTYSEGLTTEGYFMDCWPAYDRLARLAQRQMGATPWGPILDHGVQFGFDCWLHYMETGEKDALAEPFPRLVRFGRYLERIVDPDGLLRVEGLGLPTVWVDHHAFAAQHHKRCAFNLYTAAMLQHALAPICRLFEDAGAAEEFRRLGREIEERTVATFWDERRGLFVDNLPWIEEEKTPRLSDRSIANAVLFEQCPGGRTGSSVDALVDCPPEMGLSYPANAGWRLRALGKVGRADAILDDLRTRWAGMRSVWENNTLQENWHATPDSTSQWSHCAVAPLYILMTELLGLTPLAPGFAKWQIKPQLGNIGSLGVTAWAAGEPVGFRAEGAREEGYDITIRPRSSGEGWLIIGEERHRLTPGQDEEFHLPPQ